MKILLRYHDGEEYVWRTAKHDGTFFLVDGEIVNECDIVSVMNDNRKNYVICSSCGKIFPKKGNKFAKHKEEAKGINPCLKCRKFRQNEVSINSSKIIPNEDGTFTKKYSVCVALSCNYGLWTSYEINDPHLIEMCKYRNCGSAKGIEIHDTFTLYPGLFDDIITVDSILDNGYEAVIYRGTTTTEYRLSTDLEIDATVNSLGIVDRFVIHHITDCGEVVWYSKKYNRLFVADVSGHYHEYHGFNADKIREYIAKLYA